MSRAKHLTVGPASLVTKEGDIEALDIIDDCQDLMMLLRREIDRLGKCDEIYGLHEQFEDAQRLYRSLTESTRIPWVPDLFNVACGNQLPIEVCRMMADYMSIADFPPCSTWQEAFTVI